MKASPRLPVWSSLLLIAVLLLSACAPALPLDDEDDFTFPPTRTPSVTPMLTSTASGTPQPTQPIPLQARLAVVTALARLVRNNGAQTAVQQAQSADLQVQDGVELITLDGQVPQSHAIMYFPDFVNVELFASTKVVLADARQDENGAADVTVDLEAGQMFVHLNEARDVRVTVQTPNAAIRSLTSGAQFDVCRTGELTCILVKQGVVEVTVQNRREVLRAGSAGIVPNDQPLSPAICAPLPGFLAWEEDYRRLAGTPALHEEIAALPQKSCPVSASGLPWNARILYEDEFSDPGEWTQGESGDFTARYTQLPGAKYYQVDVQGPAAQYLSFVPNGQTYEDVNIDLKTRTETGHRGDFRYGVVFRRSGEQYYAFVVSPIRGMWYVLKSTANGVEVLRSDQSARIRGLEGQDTLRLESYGDTFLLFINDRFIDWVRDGEYASGEVGLFVESVDNTDARINFNAITLWVLPASARNPAQGENCFNALDDDADGWIDQADPNCQPEELTLTSPAAPSRTPPVPTRTPGTVVTRTAPPATNVPPSTPTKRPPATQPPVRPTIPPVLPTIPPILPTLPPIIPTILPVLPTLPLPLVPPPAATSPG